MNINIIQPLKARLALLITENGNHQVKVQYENLPRFCLYCGVISHDESGCKWLGNIANALENKTSAWGALPTLQLQSFQVVD